MFDEEFEKTITPEQKEILGNFRKDLKDHPIRSLNKEEYEIYAGAIFRAQNILPSFRDALAVLSPFMDATCTTAYTDRYARVGLSYWFFYLADAETRAMVVLHESMHILNTHFVRAETLKVKPRMMNYAGDFEINTNLMTLPTIKGLMGSFLTPEKYDLPDFKTFEQYVAMLQDKIDEIKEDSNPSDGSDEIDEAKKNSDSNSSDSSDGETDDNSGESSSSESGDSGSEDGESSDSGDSSNSDSDGNGESASSSGDGESGSGNQPQQSSGYGSAYDDYVKKMQGEEPSGGSGSLDDLINEEEGKGKCDGNHNGEAGGEKCDGSCDHESDGNGDSEGSNSDGGEPEPESSIDNYQRSMGSGGKKKVDKPPMRHCDDSTVKRSEAADEAGISKTSDIEQNIARNNTSIRVTEELNKAGRGNGASNDFLKLALSRMSPPQVDWRDLFRRAVANAYSASVMGQSYTSYKRVNRRYSQGSIIFPGTIDHSPTVAFGIDTSGSMGNEDFRRLLSEIEEIIKSAARQKNSLRVFSVDTTVKGIEPVSSVNKIKLHGGGGTDMSVAFAYINSLHKREMPNVVVLGTDGGTDWDSMEREIRKGKYHAIILVTQKYSMSQVPKTIHSVASVIDISSDN